MTVSQRIEQYFRSCLEDPDFRDFPSLRRIAQQLGCSVFMVQQVLKPLKESGAIVTRQGGGIYRELPSPVAKRIQKKRVRDLVIELETALGAGQYPQGKRLPAISELARSYQCSAASMHKALEQINSQLLELRGRQWWVVSQRTVSRKVIYALAQQDDQGMLLVRSLQEEEFWKALSYEVNAHGLTLKILPFQSYGEQAQLPVFSRQDCLGVIVSTIHMADSQRFIQELEKLKIPLAIRCEESDPSFRHANHTLICKTRDSRAAGFAIGEYLHQKQCKKIAWINVFGKAVWAKGREEGIRKQYAPQDVDGYYDFLLNDWEIRPGFAEVRAQLESIFFDWEPSLATREMISQEIVQQRLLGRLEPLLQKVILQQYDAWVFANDATAILAHHWLQKHEQKIKKPLLIGFDDSFEAMRYNITSFQFPIRSLVQTLVGHCVFVRKRTRPLYLKGQIVPR